MVYLGADHGGYRLKEHLRSWLLAKGRAVTDLGARRWASSDDYPAVADLVATAVAQTPGSRGILLCRTGVGVAMVANKVPGIRAAQALTPKMAARARQDENANILALGADFMTQHVAQAITQVFLGTPFPPLRRRVRRLSQMARIDAHYRRPRR